MQKNTLDQADWLRRTDGATAPAEPIAIIGIGCRFPGGAHDPASFWRMLCDGVDAISEVPADRWSIERFYSADPASPGKTTSRWGGFVDQRLERFDALFFGMSPREAAYLDPMQRWLLEVTWEALEDAGQVPARLAGSDTSVFIGCFTEDSKLLHMSEHSRDLIAGHTATGTAMTLAANRLSYLFDFHGPSVALDTACSSSLVAVHLACQSIWSGESALAIAGGVNVMFRPEYTIAESKAGMLSPDGRSKAFDSRANGYVRGEGAGVVVLKPLSAALADGDPIYALIKGSGVNQDGRTNGITVPNGRAQQALILDICRRIGIAPGQIQYAEAHGTGTAVGDPIEANALAEVLAIGRAAGGQCLLGSVKTNIGHLEAAAGIAGLIKAALALRHGQIPPHLHLQTPNPAIPLAELCIRIPQALEPWPELPAGSPRLASVNSFGFGGTNAHVILEAAPEIAQIPASASPAAAPARVELLPLSARTPAALTELARAYRDWIAGQDSANPATLRDLCFSAGLRRTHHEQRLALRADSLPALAAQLDSLLAGDMPPGMAAGRASEGAPLVFVFGGMGPQWWAMGRELLAEEPIFRAVVEECDAALRRHADWSLLGEMLADEADSRMSETWIAQPANFALQIGLAALWRSWGVVPDAIVGHSAGEVAAAYVSGALSFDDAITTIYHRSRLQHLTAGQGKLVAVGLPIDQARVALEPYAGQISVAAVNSPGALTLVGDQAVLEAFVAPLQKDGVFVRFLRVDVPYHSHYMDPLRDELFAVLADIRPQPAQIPLYSTVSGGRADGGDWDAGYWWRNVRDSVLFAAAADALVGDGYATFLEIAPHPVLGGAIQECLGLHGVSGLVVPSLRRTAERTTLLEALGALYASGRPVDWIGLGGGRFVRLPGYPWQREHHWVESAAARRDRLGRPLHPLLDERAEIAAPTWNLRVDLDRLPFLADHRVQGAAVYPGAGYIAMMLAALADAYDAPALELSGLAFTRALFLPPGAQPDLQLVFDPQAATLQVHSRADSAQPWMSHVSARLRLLPPSAGTLAAQPPTPELLATYERELDGAACYARLRTLGLEYGPAFQGIERLWWRPGGGKPVGLARISLPAALRATAGAYAVHPVLLDVCFQVVLATAMADQADGAEQSYVLTDIERISIHGPLPDEVWVRAEVQETNERLTRGNLVAYDRAGNLALEIQGVVARAIDRAASAGGDIRDLLYTIDWRLIEDAPEAAAVPEGGAWLILADAAGLGAALAATLEARGDRCFLAFAGRADLAVACGADDRAGAADRFVTDPAQPDDLRRLVETVDRAGDPLSNANWRGIIHLWSLDAAPDDLAQAQALGPLALLHIVQAIKGRERDVKIWAVTRGAQAVATPTGSPTPPAVAQTALWGAMRALGYQEHPELFGGLIDLDHAPSDEEIALLAADLLRPDGCDQVAYRDGRRYVPRLERAPIKTGGVAAPPPAFRPDGAYLITGGLGGLGLLVARWMALHGARRLILLGRSPFPARAAWSAADPATALGRRIAAVRELEALGASVHLAAVDVGDEAQLAAFLEDYRREGWPAIRGVIHAAGITTSRLMLAMTAADYAETARSKVEGAWALHRLLADAPLEHFILFSSIVAFGFTAGQADYAAANAFLDGLAHYRRALGLPALSINWGAWDEVGMAAELDDYFARRGVRLFAPAQGLQALAHLLCRDTAQASVFGADWPLIGQRNFPLGVLPPLIEDMLREDTAGQAADPSAQTAPIDLHGELLRIADPEEQRAQLALHLQRLVAQVLRLDAAQIELRQPLAALGFDSMMSVELIARARQVGLQLTTRQLFQNRTVADLAGAIDLGLRTAAEQGPVVGPLPLTPLQRFFFALPQRNPHYSNLAILQEVDEPLDLAAFQGAIDRVVAHHDGLRARFVCGEAGWESRLLPPNEGQVTITAIDLADGSPAAVEAAVAEFQPSLHLGDGPLMRVGYLRLGPGRSDRLLLLFHHLIFDGLSGATIEQDLWTAYGQLRRAEAVRLPAKTTSVKAWAEHLASQARSPELRAELDGWLALPWDRVVELPVDHPAGRAANTQGSLDQIEIVFGAEETAALTELAAGDSLAGDGAQMTDVLLAGLGQAFAPWLGGAPLLVEVLRNGRTAASDDIDLSRTVSWIGEYVPFFVDTSAGATIDATVRQVAAYRRRLPNGGGGYFALRYAGADTDARLATLPHAEVMLNYLGSLPRQRGATAAERSPDLPGLRPAPESVQPEIDPANQRLDNFWCKGAIEGDQLALTVSYSRAMYERSTVEALVTRFRAALLALSESAPISK